MTTAESLKQYLICRVQAWTCALSLSDVLETMRPLPVIPVNGTPIFVRGLTVVRGKPIPVLDAALLLGLEHSQPSRFVIVRAGARQFALAVDSLLDIRTIPAARLEQSPPMLGEACAEITTAFGTLDSDVLLVLRSARLISKGAWLQIENGTQTE